MVAILPSSLRLMESTKHALFLLATVQMEYGQNLVNFLKPPWIGGRVCVQNNPLLLTLMAMVDQTFMLHVLAITGLALILTRSMFT